LRHDSIPDQNGAGDQHTEPLSVSGNGRADHQKQRAGPDRDFYAFDHYDPSALSPVEFKHELACLLLIALEADAGNAQEDQCETKQRAPMIHRGFAICAHHSERELSQVKGRQERSYLL
jgi:hypothetical protein